MVCTKASHSQLSPNKPQSRITKVESMDSMRGLASEAPDLKPAPACSAAALVALMWTGMLRVMSRSDDTCAQ